MNVFAITNSRRSEVIGLLIYRYKYLELEAEDLFGHSASLGHNDPPHPLNLSIVIAMHFSLSDCSDLDLVLFGLRLCFSHSSLCISCHNNR